MRRRVAVVYNEPVPSRYDHNSEQKAVEGVMEAVNAVHQALIELDNDVVLLPLVPPFKEARKKLAALEVDVVFNLFEGFCGEPQTEALVPDTLTELGLVFTGCPSDVLRLALDKAKIKVLMFLEDQSAILKDSVFHRPFYLTCGLSKDGKLVKQADEQVREVRSLGRGVRLSPVSTRLFNISTATFSLISPASKAGEGLTAVEIFLSSALQNQVRALPGYDPGADARKGWIMFPRYGVLFNV